MPTYNYKCDVCGHEYSESRTSNQPQWKTSCVVDGCTGTLQTA